MNYEQSNVGLGMVPCKKGCRCLECICVAKDAEIERLTAELRLQKSNAGAAYEQCAKLQAVINRAGSLALQKASHELIRQILAEAKPEADDE